MFQFFWEQERIYWMVSSRYIISLLQIFSTNTSTWWFGEIESVMIDDVFLKYKRFKQPRTSSEIILQKIAFLPDLPITQWISFHLFPHIAFQHFRNFSFIIIKQEIKGLNLCISCKKISLLEDKNPVQYPL